MKSFSILGIAAAAALILVSGCSRQDVDDNKGGTTKRDSTVLAAMGEDVFTRADMDEFVDLRVTVEYLVNEKFKKGREQAFKRNLITSSINGWIERTLLLQEARHLGCEADQKEVEDKVASIMKGLPALRQKNATLAESITEEWMESLRASIRDELMAQAAFKAITAAAQTVTDDEINLRFRQLADYNDMAQKTNDLVMARATNVWEKLKAGADWDETVTMYTEEPDTLGHGEWSVFTPDDLERMGNGFDEVVLGLEEGGFSAPIENDNGVMILQLAELLEGDKSNTHNYKLNRIYFKLPFFYKVPTREEMQKVVSEMHQNEIYGKWLAKAKESVKVEYPSGENVLSGIITELGLEQNQPRRMPR